MKKPLLLFLFILAGAGFAHAFSADSASNYIDGNGKRQGHWIIFGRMQSDRSYANDAKVEEGNYQDNLKTGTWLSYFPNGNKKTEFTYINNRPNGHAVKFNEQGIKTEEGNWVGTRWVGEYHLYYDDGTERQAFNYSPLGKRTGKQVYKNPNGTLAIEVNEVDGKEEGWKKEYDSNGNLVRETFFNGGVIDASKTKTYPVVVTKPVEDKIKKEEPPIATPDNKPPSGIYNGEGDWTLYKNGQVTMKGTFHLKKLVNGEQRIYDNNGMLVQIKLFRNGQYIGDSPVPADANK